MHAAPLKRGASAPRRDFKIDCGLQPRDGWGRTVFEVRQSESWLKSLTLLQPAR